MSRLKSVIDNNPHKNEEHSDYSNYSDEDYLDEDYYLVDEDYELRNEDMLGLKNKHLVEQIDTYKPQHPKLHSHHENNHFQYAEPDLGVILKRIRRREKKRKGHKRWGKLKSLRAIGALRHKEEDENAEYMKTNDGDNRRTRAIKMGRRAVYWRKKRKKILKISKMTKQTLLQLTNPHTNKQVQKLRKYGIYIVGQPNDKLGQLRAKYVAVLLHWRIKNAGLEMQPGTRKEGASLDDLREYIWKKILKRKLFEAIKSDRKNHKFKKFTKKMINKKKFLSTMRSGLGI